MSVRFDPRVIFPEEAARLSPPLSSDLPAGRPSRDAQGNPPSSSHTPPPRPTEDYPRPPSCEPPRRRKVDIATPFCPTVWEVAHEMYYWAHREADISKRFRNFPTDWLLEQTQCKY